MNNMLLPCDDAERGTFDQQDVFILGHPAASFDDQVATAMTANSATRTQAFQSGRKYLHTSSGIVAIWLIMTPFMC